MTRDVLAHSSVQCKQRAAIEKLRKDNEDLKEELLLENKLSVRPTKQSAVLRIAQLQDEADTFTRKIELEKRRIGFLGLKTDDLREKIQTLRRTMGGITASRDGDRALQKQIKILENRLEKAYRTYSEGATKNRRLREMIDSYRRERLMLENINIGLEKENRKLKREMTKVVKNTKAVHEAREAALTEAANIKRRTEKLQGSYEKEWTDLFEIIEDDRKAKERKRLLEMEERERKTQELLSSSQMTDGRRRLGRTTTKPLDKQLQAKYEAMEKVQRYEMAFDQIHQATGIEDMDAVVIEIAEAEDANYTLFNYINALDKEIEHLRSRISEAKASLEATASIDRHSAPPTEKHSGVSESVVRTTTTATNNDIDIVLRGVESLIGLIPDGYFDEDVEEDVALENVDAHLSRVEAYVTDLLAKRGDATGRSDGGLVSSRRLTTATMLSIAPPSTQLDDVEGNEMDFFDDEKPAIGAILRSNAAKSIERRSRPPTTDGKHSMAATRRRF